MESITQFLEPFYPDPQEPIWILGFPAKDLPVNHPDKELQYKKLVTRENLTNNRLLQNNLREMNKRLGLYFVVNAGGTKKSEIKRANAVFCEFDDKELAEQHEIYDTCGLPPSIRVHTRKSVHAYWLLNDATMDHWRTVQLGIMARFNSDTSLKNENRVMRLPHFNHLHWNGETYEFTKVAIERFSQTKHAVDEMIKYFPYVPPPKPKYEAVGFLDDTWEGINNELRFRISALDSYHVESNRVWAVAKGICHDGNNNSALTVNLRTGAVSCKAGCDYIRILHTFGLHKPTAINKIKKVPAPRQTSELYQYLTERI